RLSGVTAITLTQLTQSMTKKSCLIPVRGEMDWSERRVKIRKSPSCLEPIFSHGWIIFDLDPGDGQSRPGLPANRKGRSQTDYRLSFAAQPCFMRLSKCATASS